MRRLAFRTITGTMALAIVAVLVIAAPSSADRPDSFVTSVTFTDVNPCSGTDHDVTLVFDVSVHRHGDNRVVHIGRSGSTSDGFEMIAGSGTFISNGNVQHDVFTDQWRHSDGAKFMVHGQFIGDLDGGDLQVENFRLQCIGRS